MDESLNSLADPDKSSNVSSRLPTFALWTLFAVSVALISRALNLAKHTLIPGLPVVGRKWSFEPLFITRFRFILNGWAITKEGYLKYPENPFTIVRPDSNVTVLPTRYVDELQNIHDDKLHPIEALSSDLHGDITGLDILLGTHLTFNVTRNKFTPRLSSMVSTFAEEIDFAIKTEIPACKDTWISVDMNTIMTRVISRLTARNWVGKDLARTDAWHTANLQTTEQVFITALILKCLPSILRPVIAPIIPTRWKLKKLVDEVLSYLVPVIEQRFRREQQAEAEGEKSNYEKPEDVIQWMMDEAEGELRDPENLARRYIYAVIGSLFPVASGLVDLMYDLAAYPEIVEPLRKEVQEVMAEDGGWSKGTAAKLVKMDSFMRESMRVNTPTPISLKRIVKEPMTLSDGLSLPMDAYVCVVNSATFDRETETFDAFRYSKKREGGNGAPSTRDQYTTTDRDHITFGHGRYACPGRFIAAVETKMVLAEMLQRYDIKFSGTSGRPKALQALEIAFQDPRTRVLIRER